MGKPTGFMEYPRRTVPYRDAAERIADFDEVYTEPDPAQLKIQGARGMDCGVPFCQAEPGCPIDNLIPEWNDLVYRGDCTWRRRPGRCRRWRRRRTGTSTAAPARPN